MQFTFGLGCDAVIITAGSSSLDPINLAGAVAAKGNSGRGGKTLPTDLTGNPIIIRKNYKLRCRAPTVPVDTIPNYEEKGLDYPPSYVRWTENRNMKAFQSLLHAKKIDLDYLTTHTFKLADATGCLTDECSNVPDLLLVF